MTGNGATESGVRSNAESLVGEFRVGEFEGRAPDLGAVPRTAARQRTRRLSLFLLLGTWVCLATLAGSELAPTFAGDLEDGRAAAEQGDWKAAAESFGLILDEKPTDRQAALGLTDAAIKADAQNYYPAAEDALLSLRERNGRDYEVLVALGRICLAIAATKSDTLALKSYNDEALKSFEAAARIQPTSEDAAVGIARVHYESAFFDKAVAAIDAYLARKPDQQARALFWKAQALYTMAGDAYRKAGALTDAVKTLFTKSQGAYAASAAADASSFQTQIQLAYASAWIRDTETARGAYLAAAVLDPSNEYPMKGLEALYAHDPAKIPNTLKALLKEHPKHPQALWFLGNNRYAAKEWSEAIDYLTRAVAVLQQPSDAWHRLGKAYAAAGEAGKAEEAYWKALAASPDNVYAAWDLEGTIRKTDPMQRARQSLKAAREVIAEYEKIIQLAPRNYDVRNNLAFTLREAYVAHGGAKKWLPILKTAIKYYVEASDLIGEFTPEQERLPYKQRHVLAKTFSDTGLMFQFYPATRDYEKAIEYYNRALEYSEDGLWDAYNNLAQIFVAEKRWDELYDLAGACAESLKEESGEVNRRGRNNAKATMEKLLQDGKVKD